ncbi:FEKKY domain-containing protein [Mesonia maritima]|uniref:CarboxypepD_reg-like domain-containing protein n=1 Tax=Mesonia maritima TaxID=1793873 RepID=A0ABU1K9K9_9FLAO|nr:carboxypeptidase-like regulatory domain-containing protein [Mesonia maritima]MDR6302294.1 hypothetical protein [Mesonia maritima]
MRLGLTILFCLSSAFLLAQEININGTVVEKMDGQPLLSVDITNNNGEKIAKTDFDGKFSIEASRNDSLTFSLDGFEAKKISVGDILTNKLVIRLKEHPNYVTVEGFHIKYDPCPGIVISPDQIIYTGKPKTFFKENKNKRLFIIFVEGLNPTFKNEKDSIYEQKFNIVYYSKAFGWDDKFATEYNKLTFKYLEKKYNRDWLIGIRMDAVGIEEHLK